MAGRDEEGRTATKGKHWYVDEKRVVLMVTVQTEARKGSPVNVEFTAWRPTDAFPVTRSYPPYILPTDW